MDWTASTLIAAARGLQRLAALWMVLALGGCGGHHVPTADVVDIRVGNYATMARGRDGRVFVWGIGGGSGLPGSGEMVWGPDPVLWGNTPVELGSLAGADDIAISWTPCALRRGEIVCDDGRGARVVMDGVPPGAVLRAGSPSLCAFRPLSREVRCVMWSGTDRFGDWSWMPHSFAPVDIIPGMLAFALGPDGHVIAHDSTLRGPPPVRTVGRGVAALGTGPGIGGCMVLRDATVRCWRGIPVDADGDGEWTAVDDAAFAPIDPGFRDVAAFASWSPFRIGCALHRDGSVSCVGPTGCGYYEAERPRWERWGDDLSVLPERVVPECAIVTRERPTRIALPAPAASVGVGDAHACAALTDGSVWCWGSNFAGQLGDGTYRDSEAPVRAVGIEVGPAGP